MLAALLCVCLAVQNVPLNALAAETVSRQAKELQVEEYSTEQSTKSKEDTSEEQVEETASERLKEEGHAERYINKSRKIKAFRNSVKKK